MVTPAAVEALEAYDWPGNIRELRNVVERAVALCSRDKIGLEDLPDHIRRSGRLSRKQANSGDVLPASREPSGVENAECGKLEDARRRAEREQLQDALRRHRNNRTSAAADLGISRVTLYNKLHRYGLLSPRWA